MPSFTHHSGHQTVIHYHNPYQDQGTFSSYHHQRTSSASTTRSRSTCNVTPPSSRSLSVEPFGYKVDIRSPRPHTDGLYSWAKSSLPLWFTESTFGYISGRAAAAHESILHDLRLEELRTKRDEAFRKLQLAGERWDCYQSQWQEVVGPKWGWGMADEQDWGRGASEDRQGNGGITVERRRTQLVMVNRKTRHTGKNGQRGREKERFGFIDI